MFKQNEKSISVPVSARKLNLSQYRLMTLLKEHNINIYRIKTVRCIDRVDLFKLKEFLEK